MVLFVQDGRGGYLIIENTDEKERAELLGLFKKLNMSNMEQIKRAVNVDDFIGRLQDVG